MQLEKSFGEIDLVQLPDTKAATIFGLLKDVLIRCSLSLGQYRGQAFDGVANMSGVRCGVQALVKKEESRALYVHCLAHSLNLSIQSAAKNCELIRTTMDFLYKLLQRIKYSPKRLTLFESIRTDIAMSSEIVPPSLRILCPTRWTVRNTSIYSVLLNYKSLLKTLDEVSKGNDEYAANDV